MKLFYSRSFSAASVNTKFMALITIPFALQSLVLSLVD